MNWAQIRQLYLSSCGPNAEVAGVEWDLHLNEGYRRVCSRVDMRELETTDTSVTTEDGLDYVPLPSDVFSVIQVDNVTSGFALQIEPAGMRGRSQYLDANSGKPPEALPQYWETSAQRLYLRPTPDDVYRLRIRYKVAPATVSQSTLDESPVLPEHLHMAVAWAAAVSFYSSHPDLNTERTSGLTRAVEYQQLFDKALQDPYVPKDRERMDLRGRAAIPGFSRMRSLW